MRNIPIRFRLALWYAALLSVALIAFSAVVYVIMARTLQGNLDANLAQRIGQVNSTVRVEDGTIVPSDRDELADEASAPAVLFDRQGRRVSGVMPPAIGAWLREDSTSLLARGGLETVAGYRLQTRPIERHGRIIGYTLVWESLGPVDDARHALLLILLGACPLIVIAATTGGVLLARRALRPVAQIADVASSISVTDLHRRVPAGKARDELNSLATTFNAMIARLEDAVARERRFAADASHELRSPLAVIRAEATLALDRPRRQPEYRRALEEIDAQAETMEELVTLLLAMARTESLGPGEHVTVPLEDVVAAAVERVQVAMPSPDVRIDIGVGSDLVVTGTPGLLAQAIRNVVHNAVKASPPDGTVWVRGILRDNEAVVTVKDEGPGITAEHLDHIFEPFYQASSARTPGDSHGLGLALCERIVRAHGGSVTVASTPGHGATFTIVLPAAQAVEGAMDGMDVARSPAS